MEYLMLSKLIEKAQEAIAEHGDMHVWMHTTIVTEFNEEYTVPAVEFDTEDMCKRDINKQEGYFSDDKSGKAFLLSGW